MESWFHACHEGQLDLIAACSRLCAEVPSGAYLGSILQRRRVLHWHLCQFCHKEEAPRGTPKAVPGREQRRGQTR